MRQGDRILKAIYREGFLRILPREEFIDDGSFQLDDANFLDRMKVIYMRMYPDNYSGDELDSIFHAKRSLVKKHYDSANTIHLITYFSEQLFSIHKKEIIVEYEKLLEWNGFQNKIDSNVFIAAYAAVQQEGSEQLLRNTNIVIRHNNERLYRILNKGICEGHMHLKGSGQTSELSWNEVLKCSFYNHSSIRRFIENSNNFIELKSYGYTTNDLLLMALKLKLIRLILSINDFEKNKLCDDEYTEVEAYYRLLDSALPAKNYAEFVGVLEEKSVKRFLRDKMGNLRQDIETSEREKACLPDRLFYFNQWKQISQWESKLSYHLYLLNYYIWGASVWKFEFYQDNLGMGFQKFKLYENVKDELVPENRLIYRSVFQKYYEEGNVKRIEMRIAPKDAEAIDSMYEEIAKINKEVFKTYQKINNELEEIKYALILHYIKDDVLALDMSHQQGRFSVYLEKMQPNFKKVQQVLHSEQTKIRVAEKQDIEYERRIVGIDTANTEVATPPEIFAPAFREHRASMEPYGGLQFTYHVGEEFKTLESGIRYIDDTINFLEYRRGDRLGHALAIGLDVEAFYRRKRYHVITNLQDYIDNVAWLYSIFSNSQHMNVQYMTVLQNWFYRGVRQLIPNSIKERDMTFSIEDYMLSMRLRGDAPENYIDLSIVNNLEEMLRRKRENCFDFSMNMTGYEEAFLNRHARYLHHLYWYNNDLIKNGKQPFSYDVNDIWIAMLQQAQHIVKKKLLDRGIVVEANPSSNRKISSVTHYTELPFLRMNSFRLTNDERKHIEITINTDDSAIFQTNLSNEYSLIACALERDGHHPENIYSYIAYLRKASCTHLFL